MPEITFEQIKKKNKKVKLDKKIKDLVIGLNLHGIKTTYSCQGHKSSVYSYPYVYILPQCFAKLFKIVRWFNIKVYRQQTKNDVVWIILPRGQITLMPELSGKDLGSERKKITLEKMQESAIEFGKMLQKTKEIPKI